MCSLEAQRFRWPSYSYNNQTLTSFNVKPFGFIKKHLKRKFPKTIRLLNGIIKNGVRFHKNWASPYLEYKMADLLRCCTQFLMLSKFRSRIWLKAVVRNIVYLYCYCNTLACPTCILTNAFILRQAKKLTELLPTFYSAGEI